MTVVQSTRAIHVPMFTGKAEDAMTFGVDLLPGSRTSLVDRWGPNEPDTEGSVELATIRLSGQRMTCTDRAPVCDFAFRPSISRCVSCPDEAGFDRYCTEFPAEGTYLNPPGNYGFGTGA